MRTITYIQVPRLCIRDWHLDLLPCQCFGRVIFLHMKPSSSAFHMMSRWACEWLLCICVRIQVGCVRLCAFVCGSSWVVCVSVCKNLCDRVSGTDPCVEGALFKCTLYNGNNGNQVRNVPLSKSCPHVKCSSQVEDKWMRDVAKSAHGTWETASLGIP